MPSCQLVQQLSTTFSFSLLNLCAFLDLPQAGLDPKAEPLVILRQVYISARI